MEDGGTAHAEAGREDVDHQREDGHFVQDLVRREEVWRDLFFHFVQVSGLVCELALRLACFVDLGPDVLAQLRDLDLKLRETFFKERILFQISSNVKLGVK